MAATRALRKKADNVAVYASTERAKRTKRSITKRGEASGKRFGVMRAPPSSATTTKVRPYLPRGTGTGGEEGIGHGTWHRHGR